MTIYKNKEDIQIINEMIKNDKRTVIVAPSYGSSNTDKRNDNLRIYSYGAMMMELPTSGKKRPKIFPGKGWDKYNITVRGSQSFEVVKNNELIEKLINAARERANGKTTQKAYEERSVETAIIAKNREDKYGSGIIIDMEFTCPKSWFESKKQDEKNTSKTGKPDLVIYDKEDKSFGIIELKYKNKSINNMKKHFSDFEKIVSSDSAHCIKKEFERKLKFLVEYNLVEEICYVDVTEAVNKPIWKAFIFVEGEKEKCFKTYNNAKKSSEFKNVGYQYINKLEDKIDFSKKKFFENN